MNANLWPFLREISLVPKLGNYCTIIYTQITAVSLSVWQREIPEPKSSFPVLETGKGWEGELPWVGCTKI